MYFVSLWYMSYADRVRTPSAPASVVLKPGWVKLPDTSPSPAPSLDQLAGDAILRMKRRWYAYNAARDLYFDYDYATVSESESESEEESLAEDPEETEFF